MDLFTRTDLKALLAEHEGPCVSLLMPTHRGGAEGDPILFRTLLARADERLVARGLRAPEAREFLAPLASLLEDGSFWPSQSDGLAVFLGRDYRRAFRLPWPLKEELVVGGLFQVTPLLPLVQGDGRFLVLALSQNSVRLFQGTRHTVSPVDLKGVPRSLAEALLTHDRDEVLTFHTRPTSGGSWGAIFQGHGVGIDNAKDDLLLYFQKIDRGLHEVLRGEQAPLVLAAVDYCLPIYRQANTYAHLLEQGVEGSPERLGDKELHDRAWALVEPRFQEAQRRALGLYGQADGTGKATSDARLIVPAARRGELETVFVARGEHLWGRVEPGTDEVVLHERPELADVDLVNWAAVHTLRHGHAAYALRPEDMPAGAPLAAIYHVAPPRHGKRP